MALDYPEEVREALAQILETACLYIRVAASRGDTGYCEVEADHVHNLPRLLRSFDRDRLEYYFSVERPAYIEALKRLPGTIPEPHKAAWVRLERYATSLER
jgi:hypothetical protein